MTFNFNHRLTRVGYGLIALALLTTAPVQAFANDDAFDLSSAVSADDMMQTRGGSSPITSTQTLNSTATGNTVSVTGDFSTGNVSIGDNFGTGMGSYVMNTGANTAINSAMTVNVEIYPGAPP